jgi:hypothetical protein
MSMLRICAADGCEVKTLGDYCLQHEKTHGAVPRLDRNTAVAVTNVGRVNVRGRVPAAA